MIDPHNTFIPHLISARSENIVSFPFGIEGRWRVDIDPFWAWTRFLSAPISLGVITDIIHERFCETPFEVQSFRNDKILKNCFEV